jgi:hypothetical protein
MTTLIVVYNSDGIIGRCDARCYNAKQPHCDCVCHGKNHGQGIQIAAQNALKDAAEWLEAAQPDDITNRELFAKTARELRRLASQTLLPLAPPPDPNHPYS